MYFFCGIELENKSPQSAYSSEKIGNDLMPHLRKKMKVFIPILSDKILLARENVENKISPKDDGLYITLEMIKQKVQWRRKELNEAVS